MLRPSPAELFKSSLKAIFKNKSRTILTSLGIIIGVTSVILLVSIGNGLKSFISEQFESLGSNLIFISPGQIFDKNGQMNRDESSMFIGVTFDQKDIVKLKRNLKSLVSDVVPISQKKVDVKYKKQKENATLIATTYRYSNVRNTKPPTNLGRWFTKQEDAKGSKLAILGFQIAQDLSPHQSLLNRKIVISGKNLRVIGILDKQGSSMGGPDLDNYIYVPYKAGASLTGDKNKIQIINIKSQNKEDIDLVKKKIKKIMLEKYDKDSFSVFDQSQVLSSINTILNTLTIALTGIAAISLVVGGIGIMNIMLVSVSERTREIGLRKAIGASPPAILIQFLFEATILSTFGGLVGIILGSLGTTTINRFFPAKVTLSSILLAFGVSTLVGIIFGVAPAKRASKLSPIEALRYE
ncbi:ABC transporter permease [Candidatus Shapirobacteria bacterium]|nr:MAG: ABC transporter permease [Candidatus Shapirobacteria bacterium]